MGISLKYPLQGIKESPSWTVIFNGDSFKTNDQSCQLLNSFLQELTNLREEFQFTGYFIELGSSLEWYRTKAPWVEVIRDTLLLNLLFLTLVMFQPVTYWSVLRKLSWRSWYDHFKKVFKFLENEFESSWTHGRATWALSIRADYNHSWSNHVWVSLFQLLIFLESWKFKHIR